MTKQTLVITQTELKDILDFVVKYPNSMCVEINIEDQTNGYHTTEVSLSTELDGDWVEITKTITHGQSW